MIPFSSAPLSLDQNVFAPYVSCLASYRYAPRFYDCSGIEALLRPKASSVRETLRNVRMIQWVCKRDGG